jgi:hypothetical protein
VLKTKKIIAPQYIGPPLDAGAKPAVFYFALSAKDSLFLDPYNQPVKVLETADMRIFSVTLPGHDILPPQAALETWTLEVMESFFEEVCLHINDLIHKKIITSCAVMGLSRGVFVAAHVAARLPSIQTLLGFAPLTELASLPGMDLETLSEKLFSKTIRCTIGSRDVRVGTEKTFSWLFKLADLAFQKGLRTSPIELIMTPSIGKDGHGTSPETFRAGAEWLLKGLS